jgi:hypothetical protein
MLLSNHNAQVDAEKQYSLGNVTVTDPNDYIVRSDIDYATTWDVITKKLIDLLGGFLQVRHVNGVNYLDYLLSGDEGFKHLRTNRSLGYRFNEILNYLEVYVRFKQRKLDLAHTFFDVCLGEFTLVLELLESVC